MKVNSVCERIKIWADRKMPQEVTLHISAEGDIKVHRKTIINSEEALDKEGIVTQIETVQV